MPSALINEKSPLLGEHRNLEGGPQQQKQEVALSSEFGDRTCDHRCDTPALGSPRPSFTPKELRARNAIIGCIVVAFLFMIAEFVGGYFANSVAIFSDALHMLSDIAGLFLSLVGIIMGAKAPSSRWSYGFKRLEVVASMMSVLLIWFIAGILVYQAIVRLMDPPKVEGKLMFIIAGCGIVSNLTMWFILHTGGAGHAHGGHGHSHGEHGHGHGHDKIPSPVKKVSEEDDIPCGNADGPHKTKWVNECKEDVETGHGHGHDHGHSHAHAHGSPSDEGHSHAHGSPSDHGHGHAHSEGHGHSHHAHDDNASEHEEKPTAHKGNINVRSAMIHVIGDLLQNVGVMIAAGFIWWQPDRLRIIDPICTLAFALATVLISLKVIRDGAEVLLDVTPRDVNIAALKERLEQIPTVANVHDLHCWYVAYGQKAFSCHISVHEDASGRKSCPQAILQQAERISRRHGVNHTTIQIEEPAHKPEDHDHRTSFCINAKGSPKKGPTDPHENKSIGGRLSTTQIRPELLAIKSEGKMEEAMESDSYTE